MDRNRQWVWVLGLLLGCAGGDPGSDTGRGEGTRGGAFNDPVGTAGDGATDAPPSTGSFGNSSVTPVAPPELPPEVLMEAECQVGERCGPEGPDPDDCGSLMLEADVEVTEHPGNVLLVFDRSGSMADDWNGQMRWEAAGTAIDNALTALSDKLAIVGSVFFPSPDPDAMPVCIDPTGIACIFVPLYVSPGTCDVSPIGGVDQLDFQPGPDFLTAFVGNGGGAPPYAPVPGGFTPLKEGLQQAQTALNGVTLEGETSVVVITDGEPNCNWDAAVSRQIVTDWAAAGIKTHVIGLPGSGNASGVLNDLAAAGGTGMFITPDDPAALEQRLLEIVSETVTQGFNSCEINIDPPAEVPEKLHLVVTEGGTDQNVPRDLSSDAGWKVSDDGALVTLEGRLCDDATEGRFEALRFEFGCVDLPPLPPPPPLE